ncbi:ASCH domain-containing protein [Ammoniphilus sp. CFH 90114]|nr:ASCH domain-containing protein [Ammoniphilus sp. CFH 90114]
MEGEGDLSLDYWRRVHVIYYKKICEQLEKEFTEELPVVFEQFEVVYVP